MDTRGVYARARQPHHVLHLLLGIDEALFVIWLGQSRQELRLPDVLDPKSHLAVVLLEKEPVRDYRLGLDGHILFLTVAS